MLMDFWFRCQLNPSFADSFANTNIVTQVFRATIQRNYVEKSYWFGYFFRWSCKEFLRLRVSTAQTKTSAFITDWSSEVKGSNYGRVATCLCRNVPRMMSEKTGKYYMSCTLVLGSSWWKRTASVIETFRYIVPCVVCSLHRRFFAVFPALWSNAWLPCQRGWGPVYRKATSCTHLLEDS